MWGGGGIFVTGCTIERNQEGNREPRIHRIGTGSESELEVRLSGRGGTGAPKGSRRIKPDLESLLKDCRHVRWIHVEVSPGFQ